eukprot:scaffold344255_cov22-Prasinocladus_malaysianus.AAC.1
MALHDCRFGMQPSCDQAESHLLNKMHQRQRGSKGKVESVTMCGKTSLPVFRCFGKMPDGPV